MKDIDWQHRERTYFTIIWYCMNAKDALHKMPLNNNFPTYCVNHNTYSINNYNNYSINNNNNSKLALGFLNKRTTAFCRLTFGMSTPNFSKRNMQC